ncbi:MAG: M15 family metallopeptidase [Actinomycetota bacterium]
MSASGGMRRRGTGDAAGRPQGSDIDPERIARRERRRRHALLLLVTSLALVVPIGLQIHLSVADQAAASQALASQAAADKFLADQFLADQVLADQAAADKALADKAAVDQAAADKAAADKVLADQAAADIKKAKTEQPKPGTWGLEPSLAQAFNRARTAELEVGLDLSINSGFRTAAAQQRLYDEGIAQYGSPEKARRWVLPPAESNHVRGLAIDVGPPAAAAWLEKNGVRYGLCRRYVNEWWHFELLAPAKGQSCPALEPYAGG